MVSAEYNLQEVNLHNEEQVKLSMIEFCARSPSIADTRRGERAAEPAPEEQEECRQGYARNPPRADQTWPAHI